jgi:NAD+ kinase
MQYKFKRLVIVYKKSLYQHRLLGRLDKHLFRLEKSGNTDLFDLKKANSVHQGTLKSVVETVKSFKIPYKLVYRSRIRKVDDGDLVITVGGDGTVLQASHAVASNPILGVNSDPARSEAVFCAANKKTFKGYLKLALEGKLKSLALYRIQAYLNGKAIKPLVLNDVLIAHINPANMSRYKLQVGKAVEPQKSSGVWVATAAGSSSALLAAGGRRLKWGKPNFQYQPRELYRGRLSHPVLKGRVLSKRESVEITWLMGDKGAVFIDGPHVCYRLKFADKIRLVLSAKSPLRLLGVRA